MTDLGDASIQPREVLSTFEQVGLIAAVSPRRILRVLAGKGRSQVTTLIADPGQLLGVRGSRRSTRTRPSWRVQTSATSPSSPTSELNLDDTPFLRLETQQRKLLAGRCPWGQILEISYEISGECSDAKTHHRGDGLVSSTQRDHRM
jgi:hypothetical protein